MSNSSENNERVAVITGGGRGIGQAIAERLVADGVKVAVIDMIEENAKAAAEAINAGNPGFARAYAGDVTDAAGMIELGKLIIGEFGKVDILVNNAGITRDGLILRMSEQDWDLVLKVNLTGSFNAIKAFQRSILKQSQGRIVNIASVVGMMGNAGQANYSASKAGLIGLTKTLAKEFAGRKVTVNAIAPGFIVTEMTDQLTDEVKAKIAERIPLGELGHMADVANAVAFFAGEASGYITGQVLPVDGGMVM